MEDSRRNSRCPVYWRSAIVIEAHGKRETIQCKTNDISISGVSVICHSNISPPHAVTVYLLIDPGSKNHPQIIVEAQGQIRNTILSGQQGGFRLGIEFTKFARDGKQVLSKHLPKDMVNSPRLVPTPQATPAVAEQQPENSSRAGVAEGDAAQPEFPAHAKEDVPAESGASAGDPAPLADEVPEQH